MRLIDVDVYCATICRCNRRACDRAKCPIHNAPTAYDIDKVVEELEEWSFEAKILVPNNNELGEYEEEVKRKIICTQNAIEIVKHGSVGKDVE